MKIEERIEKYLNEGKKRKPAFGSNDGFDYAVQINNLDSNDFLKQPFGRQLDDWKKVKEFQKEAKRGWAGAKGKSTMPAVKKWIKENGVTEFFARWQSDSSSYSDDSVEIYYKK